MPDIPYQQIIAIVCLGLIALFLAWFHGGEFDPDVGIEAIKESLRRGRK